MTRGVRDALPFTQTPIRRAGYNDAALHITLRTLRGRIFAFCPTFVMSSRNGHIVTAIAVRLTRP